MEKLLPEYGTTLNGILDPMLNLKQSIRLWWDVEGNYRVNLVCQAIPSIILWILGKRRNTILHGGVFSEARVIWGITDTVLKFIHARLNVNCSRNSWPHIISEIEQYRPIFEYRIVRWEPPPNNVLKCHTDGASKGNPGPSSATFCISDHDGNLVVAKGFKIPNTTNMEAEAIAIRESLLYCSEHGIEHVILETDSLTMVNILEGEWDMP